ncbi:unnamed protein product [Staurois parvus]|uniref:Uncharacterized protein n=1 Tax=Staurois parvus TaxID=386267 RepID=A0ABN9H0T5_9NEOB|nr:unnamed protein product [Staurois parvus]
MVRPLQKALHTPVPLVCWLLSNSGPRIGDFIPPKSLRNLQATGPKTGFTNQRGN